MKEKQNLDWLKKKLEALSFFNVSLLGYISSSPDVKQLATRLSMNPSEILKLDANENFFVDIGFLNGVLMNALRDLDLRVYDPKAMVDLRKALGIYVGAPAECLVAGSGSEQLIDFIVQFFLEKGDEAVSIVPSFFMYEKRVWLSGAKLVTVPLKANLSLDVDGILEKVTEKTKLIFICSPNNPTGNQFSWDKIETLAEKSSAVVVVDEAYVEFGDISVCSKAVKKDNVVVVRTFSKAFGLAGLRFGYFVANKDLASALSEVVPYTVSTVCARFVEKLLDKLGVIQGWIDGVKKERERLIKELSSIGGTKVFDSKANFVTFKPKVNTNNIYEGLLDRGIVAKNLGDLPVIGHCLRVTVGLPQMNTKFLNVLKQILE